MLNDFVHYYDRELAWLRRAGLEFARKYPKIAQRLELRSTEVPDPHVERLLEGFAFLTARIHHRLDDDASELSEALLGALAPHALAPIPSLCIVQFHGDSTQGRTAEGRSIPRLTSLFTAPVAGTRCSFRSCYDVTLWPIEVATATFSSPRPDLEPPRSARSVLTLRLQTTNRTRFSELDPRSLRFYLHGNERQVCALLEFLLNQVSRVDFVALEDRPRVIHSAPAAQALQPVGFEPDQGLLEYDTRTLAGHRLLLEYFCLPQKFLFTDLVGLERVVPRISGQVLEVLCYSDAPVPAELEVIDASMFRLGCTPAVNLFRKLAEPIPITHTAHEYCVVPDRFRQNAMEVYAIEGVRGAHSTAGPSGGFTPYPPIYGTAHAEVPDAQAWWHASRRPSLREGDEGTDVFLAFVGQQLDPRVPMAESVLVDTLCTNRDLPAKLPFGEVRSDFNIEGQPACEVRCLSRPTPARRPGLGRSSQWRLVSHLLVQLQSVLDPHHGREVLKELLSLYDVQDSAATRQQIAGILRVEGRPMAARVTGPQGQVGMARGMEVTVELDPEQFVGSSVLLFASVLERFLASHISMNAFCRLSVTLKGRPGYLKRWPPRAGERPLM